MRIVYFANNRVGLEVLRYLTGTEDEIVALVTHPDEKARNGQELIDLSGLPAERIFSGDSLRQSQTIDSLAELGADSGVSVFFGYILRPEILNLFPEGCLNLHPGYLPYGRGSYPNVWNIVENTPAGATLHYMDDGVDTGDIVSQAQIRVLPTDTGASLYKRLEESCIDLFKRSWPAVRQSKAPRTPQETGGPQAHRVRDVEEIDRIDLDRTYQARELIDLIRARTYPPHRGAYIEEDGTKVYLRLELLTEDSLGDPDPESETENGR